MKTCKICPAPIKKDWRLSPSGELLFCSPICELEYFYQEMRRKPSKRTLDSFEDRMSPECYTLFMNEYKKFLTLYVQKVTRDREYREKKELKEKKTIDFTADIIKLTEKIQ